MRKKKGVDSYLLVSKVFITTAGALKSDGIREEKFCQLGPKMVKGT